MGFDRAVNGSNYLFGESVSLINFIKVCTAFVYVFLRVLAGNLSLLSLVPFYMPRALIAANVPVYLQVQV